MPDDLLIPLSEHLRARKLAALCAAPGPEGAAARSRLRKLVAEHPGLAYLDTPDPMSRVQSDVKLDRPGRWPLLRELCYRFEVSASVDLGPPGEPSTVRLDGRQADVQGVLSGLSDAEGRLASFLEGAASAWACFAKLPDPIPENRTLPVDIAPAHPPDERFTRPTADHKLWREVSKLLERAAKKLLG